LSNIFYYLCMEWISRLFSMRNSSI
jgi:hypothetical protein